MNITQPQLGERISFATIQERIATAVRICGPQPVAPVANISGAMANFKIMISDKKNSMSPDLNQSLIDSINVPQGRAENKAFLETLRVGGLSGVDALVDMVGLDVAFGLTPDQIESNRATFGTNAMPASPTTSYFMLLVGALSDTTLLILIAAACVSFAIGYWEDPKIGWIEGAAIFIAVFLVSNISAGNDYSKELQFRALEASSAQDQRASVFRSGQIDLINPAELVVGDIFVLQVIYLTTRCE